MTYEDEPINEISALSDRNKSTATLTLRID